MKIKLLGIDLTKNVFQLCALNKANKVLFNRTVRRAQLRSTIVKLEPTTIAMEACSSAHYWGRAFETQGHKVIADTRPTCHPLRARWQERCS